MQLNITGHHIEVTPALRDRLSSKMQRLERHFDHVTQAHVVLTVEKLRHKAEATLNVARGQLHAEATENDMYAAIDALMDRLDRQIRKHKTKLKNHHQRDADKSRLA